MGKGWSRPEKPENKLKRISKKRKSNKSSLWQRICKGGARHPANVTLTTKLKDRFHPILQVRKLRPREALVPCPQSQSQSGHVLSSELSACALPLPHPALFICPVMLPFCSPINKQVITSSPMALISSGVPEARTPASISTAAALSFLGDQESQLIFPSCKKLQET